MFDAVYVVCVSFFRLLVVSLLCCLFWGHSVQSAEFQFSLDGDEMIQKASAVRLYNFSDKLIESAENCTPYLEDFTAQNPELRELGAVLGGLELQVMVDVQGQKDNKCLFSISQVLKGMGGTKYICSIDEEQRKELVRAMKSRSTELLTETYTSYMISENQIENTVEKIPVETTMTDGLFNITMAKIMANSCDTEEYIPTEEEQQSAQDNFNKFSDYFKESLKMCTPDIEERTFFFISVKAEILGKKGDRCLVRYDAFDLLVSKEMADELSGFDDLDELIKKSDVAEYNKKSDYETVGLLFEIKNCYANQNNNLRGNFLSKNPTTKSFSSGSIKIIQGLSFEYKNSQCVVKLNNKVEIDNLVQDYGLSCLVKEDVWRNIQEKYADILVQGEEKSETEFISFGMEDRKLTENTDKEIFEYLKSNGFCS